MLNFTKPLKSSSEMMNASRIINRVRLGTMHLVAFFPDYKK